MVFGIGEGSIAVELEKTAYCPGETIRGKVKLHMGGPKKARALLVEFFGEKRSSSTTHSGGHSHHRSSTVRVHEQRLSLSGEKEYGEAELPFEFRIPDDAMPQMPGGLMGAVAGLFQQPVRWYVRAWLDLPMAIDISKQVQITLQRS